MHLGSLRTSFGGHLSRGQIVAMAAILTAIVAAILLRRVFAASRRRQALAYEVDLSLQVQQILFPGEIPQPAGYSIAAEYRPDREIGGDFFQILPHPYDGSVLIVIGDVTGKELHAGVLIAFIVGAIRTAAQFYPDPLAVLVTLNERLCNLKDAQATCLGVRIGRDGGVTLVNAGHPPPYLNGDEVAIEGALPLGMTADAEFPVSYLQLAQGDTLTLVSDGVAKAHAKRSGLFGFERIQELLRKRSTADELATAAQEFGQSDDISVLSITRRAVRRPAPDRSAQDQRLTQERFTQEPFTQEPFTQEQR